MFRKVDAVRLHVDNIGEAVKFYRDALGHELVWRRKDDSAAVRLEDSDTEIVLVREQITPEVDFLVESVEKSALAFEKAGGRVIIPAFEISIGNCSVVQDPWGTGSSCWI